MPRPTSIESAPTFKVMYQERALRFDSQRVGQSSKLPAAKDPKPSSAATIPTGVENPLSKKSVTIYDFKDYIREIESVSGIQYRPNKNHI